MTPEQVTQFKTMWCAVIDGLLDVEHEAEVDAALVAVAALEHADLPAGTDPDMFRRTLHKMAAHLLAYAHGGDA